MATIKELVEASGMTQTAFAEKYRLPLRSLQHWIAGDRKPPEYLPSLIGTIMRLEKTGWEDTEE